MLLVPSLLDTSRDICIATLGPHGTSSEAAAQELLSQLGAKARGSTQLYRSYEAAGRAVLDRRAGLLLVASAYQEVAQFYMHTSLALAAAFINYTPQYGLASLPATRLPAVLRIATHPAPIPLIVQLIPEEFQVGGIIRASSTSAAVRYVLSGDADVALTTAPAASASGLTFMSKTRRIQMLWSVFHGAQIHSLKRVSDLALPRASQAHARKVQVGA